MADRLPPALVFGAGFGLAVYLLTPFLWPLQAPPGPARIDAGRARIGLVSELPPLPAEGWSSAVLKAPGDVARGILRFPELLLRWRRLASTRRPSASARGSPTDSWPSTGS